MSPGPTDLIRQGGAPTSSQGQSVAGTSKETAFDGLQEKQSALADQAPKKPHLKTDPIAPTVSDKPVSVYSDETGPPPQLLTIDTKRVIDNFDFSLRDDELTGVEEHPSVEPSAKRLKSTTDSGPAQLPNAREADDASTSGQSESSGSDSSSDGSSFEAMFNVNLSTAATRQEAHSVDVSDEEVMQGTSSSFYAARSGELGYGESVLAFKKAGKIELDGEIWSRPVQKGAFSAEPAPLFTQGTIHQVVEVRNATGEAAVAKYLLPKHVGTDNSASKRIFEHAIKDYQTLQKHNFSVVAPKIELSTVAKHQIWIFPKLDNIMNPDVGGLTQAERSKGIALYQKLFQEVWPTQLKSVEPLYLPDFRPGNVTAEGEITDFREMPLQSAFLTDPIEIFAHEVNNQFNSWNFSAQEREVLKGELELLGRLFPNDQRLVATINILNDSRSS